MGAHQANNGVMNENGALCICCREVLPQSYSIHLFGAVTGRNHPRARVLVEDRAR